MPRRITILLFLAALVLPACSSRQETSEVESALMLAESAREDFVEPSLQMLLAFADRVAPLCQARDEAELAQLAQLFGGSVAKFTEGGYTLLCPVLAAGTHAGTMHVQLEFVDEQGSSVPLGQASRLRAFLEAEVDSSLTEGLLECAEDPASGVVIEGTLSTWYSRGGTVWTRIDRATAMAVPDLPEGLGILFTSGDAELDVLPEEGPVAEVVAALVGRRALVVVEVEGQQTIDELDLG